MNYWLFVIATVSLTAFVSYGTFATAKLLKTWKPDRNLLLIPAENAFRVALIVGCLGLGRLSGLRFLQLGWHFPNAGRQIAIGLATGLGLGLVFYYTTRWLIEKTGDRFYSTVIIEHILPTNRRETALVSLAMLGAVALEELLFRSLLLGGLAPLVPVPILAVGLSVVFGLLHSPQGKWGMVGAGLAGLLLSLLFLWQNSLLAPLVAHYAVNMYQVFQAQKTVYPSA